MSERKKGDDRGTFRSTFDALADDLEFQDLTPLAQAVWQTLKLKLGQYGISVFYTAILTEFHRKATAGEIECALQELEEKKASGARGWIVRERNVVWMVNGLRFEPSISLENRNNLAGAKNYLLTLPRLAVVQQFATYYGLSEGAAPPPAQVGNGVAPPRSASMKGDAPPPGATGGGGTPPPTPPPSATRSSAEPDADTPSQGPGGAEKREERIAKREERIANSDGDLEHLPAAAEAASGEIVATASPAAQEAEQQRQQQPSLPLAARRLLKHYYGLTADVVTPTARQAQVERDLRATLTEHGVRLQGDVWVRAFDEGHLASVCLRVLEKKLEKPDSAIQHVLLALGDTWLETKAARERRALDATPPSARSGTLSPISPALLRHRPSRTEREDYDAASAWLATQPTAARENIERIVELTWPKNKGAPSVRDQLMRDTLIQTWRTALAADGQHTGTPAAAPEELAHAS